MPIIAPSVLSADFLNLGRDIEMLNESEAEWLHLDVMDGRFVPNISYGPMIIEFIRKATKKFCDAHLMIVEPEKYVEAFFKAGCDNITVHYEACPHLHRNIQQIKSFGIKAGVSINPHTPVSVLENIIADVDVLLIMSVNPGFGGQKFIPQALEKVRQAKELIRAKNSNALIEVDGGVSLENAEALKDAGADVLVAGNAVFKAADQKAMIASLRNV